MADLNKFKSETWTKLKSKFILYFLSAQQPL
jgi:hypothetical protein